MINQANVDPVEMQKFKNIASSWWDLEGAFKALHQINPLRLNYIIEHSNGIFGKNILDVGCGGGILTESMGREYADVTGLDMCKEPLMVARLHAVETNIQVKYIQSTAEKHATSNIKQYDIVTCMEMLEHVPDPASVITSCARMVKSGGHVFFATLNRNIKSWLFAIVGAESIMKIVPKGTHNYNKFIRPSELLRMIDSTRLKERHITGLHYNPLTERYWLSPKNVDVNYIIHTDHPA
ncbi:bifunctional 2-polyprenyl-6-hydroxyphenol methylase/3-demethylubiquinol 3-O-methyltransferase UbiG [Candidatus Enterovibrio altilux]|uniref:Ubiquinone biosynthesis O-methyltransferase n=1 Tax=Candidatus Enterovibrio altilux TaxID=1927128 RepID=A0A291BBE0_9GAMM|nr:bifunctional 2-polyprenyl-6-hydroxyphenol methylase/3-demethylubiquinol 3-O-methyltransferase UbiG [Candidatus Enterovibrio luxaltus]ATF10338.1 3-demethylubiquinone-9 3-methyltransferase [Candidatus Enterovibrio luxaltus]